MTDKMSVWDVDENKGLQRGNGVLSQTPAANTSQCSSVFERLTYLIGESCWTKAVQ